MDFPFQFKKAISFEIIKINLKNNLVIQKIMMEDMMMADDNYVSVNAEVKDSENKKGE